MIARASMTMRAFVERDSQGSTDPLGHPLPPTWQPLYSEPVPCFTWTSSRLEQVRDGATVTIVEVRTSFPDWADITERDRVSHIVDRLGNMLHPGPFNIRSVEWKNGHWEALLQGEAG